MRETECRRQPRSVHFQRRKHPAELPACKVIRQLHHQALGPFDGRKECILSVGKNQRLVSHSCLHHCFPPVVFRNPTSLFRTRHKGHVIIVDFSVCVRAADTAAASTFSVRWKPPALAGELDFSPAEKHSIFEEWALHAAEKLGFKVGRGIPRRSEHYPGISIM
jgi:hypothetical protein